MNAESMTTSRHHTYLGHRQQDFPLDDIDILVLVSSVGRPGGREQDFRRAEGACCVGETRYVVQRIIRVAASRNSSARVV